VQSLSRPRRRFCFRSVAHTLTFTRHINSTRSASIAQPKKRSNLTRSRVPTLELRVRACAIAFAPSTPTWLPSCSVGVTLQARHQRNTLCKHSTNKNEIKSHKEQGPDAGVVCESLRNRFRALISDLVAVMYPARYSSRTKPTHHAKIAQTKK
jgi:hypothetical protein